MYTSNLNEFVLVIFFAFGLNVLDIPSEKDRTRVEGMNVFIGVDRLEVRGEIPRQFTELTCDSRSIQPGSLFVALRGTVHDGHQFIEEVAACGAGAAVVDTVCESCEIPQIRVQDTLAALPRIAANFYRHPSKELSLIGITGSNGKTTSAYLLESVFHAAGQSTGVIGTIEYRYAGKHLDAPNTTPLPHDLQRLLREMSDAQCRRVVMEVSSHGLALHRVDEIEFDIALFTNLSQDHLDFHETMDSYREAKKLLFTRHLKSDGIAVLNRDDATGRQYEMELKGLKIITFGIEQQADFRAQNIELSIDGTHFDLRTPDGQTRRILTHLIGRHNVENIVGVIAAAWACGVPFETIVRGIQAFSAVPGRLQSVPNGIGAQVVVDYCHTPDALEKCLLALHAIPHKRIITLFGCGGDRDPKKRPIMGEIALRLSDRVIVTSDNPRTEDPQKVIQDILAGMQENQEKYTVIPDRREALFQGIKELSEGDIFLIAGKGHENYQIIGRQKFHFDDREIAAEYLHTTGKGVSVS